MNHHTKQRKSDDTCRGARLTVTVVLLFCAPLCHAFLTPPTLRPHRVGVRLHAAAERPPGRSSTNKKQTRPPRFTQTVHKETTGNTKSSTSSPMNADRVWQSRKKSVEELEDILATRWGTNLNKFTAQDWDEDDDDDEQQPGESSSDAPVFRAKPVADPWTTAEPSNDDDYYDEDDEGYNTKQGSLGYMMAPKPAGASGRTSAESSYFLRPPPAVVQDKETAPTKTTSGKEKKVSSSSAAVAPTEPTQTKKRERIAPLNLLHEDGKQICLSIEQAQRLFREMTGGTVVGAATNDDDEDSPLAARTAQQSDHKQWTDLGITDATLLENLSAMACAAPLPVQQSACPAVLAGESDVVIGTYTGSGKTLSFLVPALQRCINDGISPEQLSILVVAPGRELASQIVSVARALCAGTSYTAQLAIGGTTFTRNLQTIRQRRPSIIVGTPGRLAELIVGKPGEKGGRLKVSQLQSLVLDEFDALLEYKAHREPTMALVGRLQRNPNIQSILCSATASDMLESPKFQRFVRPDYTLAMTDQDDVFVTGSSDDKGKSQKGRPVRVSRTVMHGVVHVPHRRFVIDTLRRILHTEPVPQQILMFVESSRKVDIMVEKLESMGILAASLHGGMHNDKMDRAEVSKALREGYVGIVVATEMAARGLDAPLLTHVINVDLPTDASHYAHRAGRCGRGGRPGVVLNLTSDPKERKVPQKFADQLGIDMYTVDVKNGRLNVVDPESVDFDSL